MPQEREFIRGNRDGKHGRNDTYTVCRVDVSLQRFEDECHQGLHPNFVLHRVSPAWRCPAHARKGAATPATVADYAAKWPKLPGEAHEVEMVHAVQSRPSSPKSTCVICRFKVLRDRLVEEVKGSGQPGDANLHPGYHAVNHDHVRGNPGVEVDNVNHRTVCDFCVFN